MKFNIKHIVRSTALCSLAALSLVACEDEPDKYEVSDGTPEIICICMPTNKDSLITSAYTNNRVVLMGNNLRSITKLYFNDQEAVLNSSLITDHTLFVTVPRNLPNNPTDKIYMYNNEGVVTEYPFTVDISAPLLSSMTCEYVAPGEVATINGDYLLSYETNPMVITMPDGQQITDFKSLSQTSVSFVVPEGCTASGAITVKTAVTDAETIVLTGTSLTGTVKQGDLLVIGDKKTQHTVLADATASGNAISVKVSPKITCAAGTTVQLIGSHTANLAFHPMAFAFVTRPLPTPGGVESYTTHYNGIDRKSVV